MIRVDIGGYLKDESGKFRFFRLHLTFFRLHGTGTGSNLHKAIQQFLHTEIIQCRTEEYGSKLPFQIFLLIKFGVNTVYQFQFSAQLVGQLGTNPVVQLLGMDIHFHLLCHHLLTGLVEVKIMLVDVVDTLETDTALDRPRQRAHVDVQFLLQLVQQVERVFGFTVHLVDEDNHRRITHTADLHQLACLRFHTFRTVHHDDNTVHSRQRAVGIFSKVLVTRSIKDVDLVVMVVELHYRSGNGNTTLFFNIHPVRRCRLLYLIALYGTRHLDLSTKKQQLLGQ